MKNEVVIVGGSDGRDFTPYDLDADYWGVTDLSFNMEKCDAIFEIHSLNIIQQRKRTKNYYQKLKETDIPVYMQKKYKVIPASVKYPYLKIVRKYGKKFFSTIDYMIALAIEKGYEKIYLYGVDLAIYEEYLYQRPSCMYWIGLASGLGIDVVIQEESGINMKGAYGFKVPVEQTLANLMRKAAETKSEILKVDKDIAFTEGVLTSLQNLQRMPNLDTNKALESGSQSRLKIIALKVELEDKLKSLTEEISEITGHNVIIPEREIEVKK